MMAVKIIKTELTAGPFKVNALAFLPSENRKNEWALFTHGYTSHKGDCLNWATRLSEAGVPTVIFDLPGHYLGSFNEVESLDEFRDKAHHLFASAYVELRTLLEGAHCETLILGGHSLGALLCMKALGLVELSQLKKLAVGIGFGISQHKTIHLFETSFYQKTLSFRSQLVSPAIHSTPIFQWIKDEKEQLEIKNERIHLITGEDDLVVGEGGMEALEALLVRKGNEVTTYKPVKLPHHTPEMVTPHLFSFLKNHFNWR